MTPTAAPTAGRSPVAAGTPLREAPSLEAPSLEALVLPTPAGPLAVLVTPEDGVVRAAGFADAAAVAARLPAPLAARGARPAGPGGAAGRGVVDAVAAYADGVLTALDAVAVAQPGGEFLQAAWAALRRVAPGGTVTYAGLAAAAGRPAAVRAAGSACARNLVAPFVPCHRVVRAGGALGGYAYGLGVKERLLDHEGARPGAPVTRPGAP